MTRRFPKRMIQAVTGALVLTFLIPQFALAQQESTPVSAAKPSNVVDPGHSYHGEVFNEGPRRAAYLMGNTGRVSFPVTSRDPRVQDYVNQGIGQLHGFWYFEAERSFRQAAAFDHNCAMTYWGMALANVNNEKRAKGFLAEAVRRKDQVPERERMYIEALDAWYKADTGDEKKKKTRAQNYVNALENIVHKFGDDLEAKAFLAASLWHHRSDLSISSYFAIDALLNSVLAVNPLHPVHHYRIHLWDNDKARQAENSAEKDGLSAPGIAHMWHMSGHTYSDLKQYFDAAWHQEAATRVDHAYMMRDVILPGRIHNFAHNNEWLVRTMMNVGRVRDAIALSRNTIELPRHPKYNAFPSGGTSAHYGRLRLFDCYSHHELWDELIADAQTQYLGPTDDHAEQVKRFRLLGRAYFRKGNVAAGKAQLAVLENRLKRLQQDQTEAMDKAAAKARHEKKDTKAVDSARDQAKLPTAEKIRVVERAVDELTGHVLLAEGKPTEALERFKKSSGMDDVYLAEIQFLSGKKDEAIKALVDLANSRKNEVRPLAGLVQLLWQHGKKDEAKQQFEKLRGISGSIDMNVAPYTRLEPIAVELGFGKDWRKPKPVAKNATELPDIATLGPLLWQPSPAANWSLPDENGHPHSLAEYRGRPVIIIFYLGAGCLHCVEQLQAFAPKTKDFETAGIALVAISTEDVPTLKKAQESYRTTGSFPFPLLSDESRSVFKKYQAFDDFENQAIHATCLIDGEGRIRWHDEGAEPFRSVDFLLKESKRLLVPNLVEFPPEPVPLDDNRPANALDPMNVFPSPNPPPSQPGQGGPNKA